MSFVKIKYKGTSRERKIYYKDEKYKIIHREDGPAVEYIDGSKEWLVNGELHREEGPAIEDCSGAKEWWINGMRHRECGSAIEHANGEKIWYINGLLHREDGPAIEYRDCLIYYLNGFTFSKYRYDLEIKRLNNIKKFGGFV